MSISLNGFGLSIFPSEKVTRNGSTYFTMPDKTEYTIELSNDRGTKTDVHVWIDGKKVGVWRLSSYSRISIERPVDVQKKFVLLKEGTNAAYDAEIKCGKSDNGLVKVEFRPEREGCFDDSINYFGYDGRRYFNQSSSINKSFGCNNQMLECNSSGDRCSGLSAAGTGLGSDSHQRFRNVDAIHDVDIENITEINARLVVDNNSTQYRQFTPLREQNVRYSNSVPPPLYH
ncbi:MAG: hypothetical protein MUO21_10025 [Nitrososphaeraceae archaeon]|nr:hypothetical protein [Nitrososphaeraceae archaeon]